MASGSVPPSTPAPRYLSHPYLLF
jgi:hypothetical protein